MIISYRLARTVTAAGTIRSHVPFGQISTPRVLGAIGLHHPPPAGAAVETGGARRDVLRDWRYRAIPVVDRRRGLNRLHRHRPSTKTQTGQCRPRSHPLTPTQSLLAHSTIPLWPWWWFQAGSVHPVEGVSRCRLYAQGVAGHLTRLIHGICSVHWRVQTRKHPGPPPPRDGGRWGKTSGEVTA